MNFDDMFNDILNNVCSDTEKRRVLKRINSLPVSPPTKENHPIPLTSEKLKALETFNKRDYHEFDTELDTHFNNYWAVVDKEPPFDIRNVVNNIGEGNEDYIIEITYKNEPRIYSQLTDIFKEMAEDLYIPYIDDRSDDYD